MNKALRVGLLYETEAAIRAAHPEIGDSARLYHWREPEEIEAVSAALQELGCSVDDVGDLHNLLHAWRKSDLPDVVVNLSVRALSRNRTALAPALLEQIGLPYCGADAVAKALSLNKDYLKPWLQSQGILTPEWQCYVDGAALSCLPPWQQFILKPVCEGYSLGLQRGDTTMDLAQLRHIIDGCRTDYGVPMLCEQFIAGREITIAVIQARPEPLVGVSEVTWQGNSMGQRVLDLSAKRASGMTRQAVDRSEAGIQQAIAASLKAMQGLGHVGYASFDFRIDESGAPYLIDINCDATLHPQRAFAYSLACEGVAYQTMIQAILLTTLSQWGMDSELLSSPARPNSLMLL